MFLKKDVSMLRQHVGGVGVNVNVNHHPHLGGEIGVSVGSEGPSD